MTEQSVRGITLAVRCAHSTSGVRFESDRDMSSRLAIALLLLAACRREEPPAAMRPMETTPAPPAPITQTLGQEPMITTTGSPRPYPNERLTFEPVTISSGSINVRSPLPVKSTVFRVVNRDAQPHQITVRAADGQPAIPPE